MLHGKFVNVADFLTQFVSILTDFRVDKFGIYLCGKNGIMPQNLLQGFQRHPFEDGKNGESMAADMRGNLNLTTAFLSNILKAAQQCLIFSHGKNMFRRDFPFVYYSVLFYEFNSNGVQFYHIGDTGFYTVAH